MHNIKFIEDTHTYLTETGEELISVSAFTEKFKSKTDWKDIARKVAAKQTKQGEPTTAEEILQKWENKRNKSSEIGTIYHTLREEALMKEENPIFYNTKCETKQCVYTGTDKWSIPINKLNNNTVYPELMIYDMDYMICGQADKVIVTNKKINIWDYKTDTEIKYQAFSNMWTKPQKLLGPLGHLDDCNANIYSIKMSLYMYLLWKANKGFLKPGDIIIEHVHLERDMNNDNLPILQDGKPIVKKIEQITLPYRKKRSNGYAQYPKIKSMSSVVYIGMDKPDKKLISINKFKVYLSSKQKEEIFKEIKLHYPQTNFDNRVVDINVDVSIKEYDNLYQ